MFSFISVFEIRFVDKFPVCAAFHQIRGLGEVEIENVNMINIKICFLICNLSQTRC